MKKFNFELQPLLNLKQQTEDLLKTNLSNEKNKALEKQQQISNLLTKKATDINKFELNLKQTSNFYSVTSFYSYLESLTKQIELHQVELEKIEVRISEISEELNQVSKEKKILEKLKDKEFESYKEEINKEEFKLTDQKNSYNYFSEKNRKG